MTFLGGRAPRLADPGLGVVEDVAQLDLDLLGRDPLHTEALDPRLGAAHELDVLGRHLERLREQREGGVVGAPADRRRRHPDLERLAVAAHDRAATRARLHVHVHDDGVVLDVKEIREFGHRRYITLRASVRRGRSPLRPGRARRARRSDAGATADVFDESLRRREGAPEWVFYEGPPTANGRPGLHHVLARAFKDLYPRFHTMRGRYVARKGGWDCHGLPVEVEVEKELGFSGKPQIEEYGIEAFNQRCRESVQRYVEDWSALTSRIGMWLDTADAYWTLEQRVHRERLVDVPPDVGPRPDLRGVQGRALLRALRHRALEPRARAARRLPGHHRAVGLRAVPGGRRATSTSSSGRRRRGRWCRTSPRPSAPISTTCGCAVATDGAIWSWPPAAVADVLGDDAEVVGPVPVADLVGLHYERPFDFLPIDPGASRVVAADFVTLEDGSGIVHLAPAFGEVDREAGEREGLPVLNPVNSNARFDESVPPPYTGKFVKDADSALIDALAAAGKLEAVLDYTHSYPHCWRCGTPLIYWAKPTWFAATSTQIDRLLRENETIGWHPEHIKHGRFGDWLENNVDWALSRDRFWGTPIPVWRCRDCEADTCIGSLAELTERAGRDLTDLDLHRPYVDDVAIACPDCGGRAFRVEPVLDAWFDSGSHAVGAAPLPVRARGRLRASLSRRLHLRGHRPDARVVLLAAGGEHAGVRPHAVPQRGVPRADRRRRRAEDVEVEGQRHRPVVDPRHAGRRRAPLEPLLRRVTVDARGACPRRASTSRPAGSSSRCGTRIPSSSRTPTSTTGSRARQPPRPVHVLDRWARSRLHSTVAEVTAALDDFDSFRAAQALDAVVDDLSNWYVRRSRAAVLEGRRRSRARRAARVPGDHRQAAGAVLPVPRRRHLRQPRRRHRLGAPR